MDQDERTEAIHVLDLKYRDTMHQTDLVVKDEEARRLKLRVVVLRDEVATLRDQLADKDSRIRELSQQYDDIVVQLDRVNQTCTTQETQLRSQARQQSELKAELLSASNMSEDSAKVLSEKLALSRELAVLKPEIDHLRSQLSHQKDVLAEKLALERQLNTLEVELANEKRATQKALQRRETQDNDLEEELRQRVADLEKKLAAEQKAAQKAKKAQDKAESGADEDLRQQIADLEERLAAEQKAFEKARKTYQKVQTDAEEELRKQVADLEAKLANEKRAAQKAKRSQDNDSTEEQTALQEKLKELEAQIVSDKREVERTNKISEKEAAAARDQIEMLTQRVEEFKGKLRETRAELKEVRADLTQARTKTTSVPIKNDDDAKKPLSKTKAGKKRGANEISVDEMMLDTPGHTEGRTKRPLKKRGIEFTAVGEKSTFSITPFLEKSNTLNLAETIEEEVEEPSILEGKGDPAAPIIEPEAETTEEIPAAEMPKPKSVAKALKATKAKPAAANEKKARGRSKAQTLAETSPNKLIATGSKADQVSGTNKLEKVVEEPEDIQKNNASKEDAPLSKKMVLTINGSADTSNTSSEIPEPKKKKRKLLGASNKGTLFDKDEDADEAEAPAPTAAATKRKPVGLKASSTRKGPVSALARGAFAGKTFSPLKKDRRGVGASFLA
ncbi:hypothetical protein N0V93_000104 [Gnomoniopsis smithogilvyi]|uniref:Uncharacterized protein n=1 Tax=Gnomoniopsis smithogilvyi TaxID=1191159 RepID=A0A9W8YZL9_9PEZI|nr:hypothetical protein N0V93_000104 [Gnomoniopsis smithogilvyi]